MACNKFSTFILMLLAVRMCLAQENLRCKAGGLECLKKAKALPTNVAFHDLCSNLADSYSCFVVLGCAYNDMKTELKPFVKLSEAQGCDTSDLMWHNEDLANDDDLNWKKECETRRIDCVENALEDETPAAAELRPGFCKKLQEAHDCIANIVGKCEKGDLDEQNSILKLAIDKKCDFTHGLGTSEGATTKPPVAILLLSAILFLFAL